MIGAAGGRRDGSQVVPRSEFATGDLKPSKTRHQEGNRKALGVLSSAFLALPIVLLSYLALTVVLLRGYGFNPSGPIHIGDAFAGQRFWSEATHVEHGIGYDGQ